MLNTKSVTVAALSALITVSTFGAVAQQTPIPQEGVESPELQKMGQATPQKDIPPEAVARP